MDQRIFYGKTAACYDKRHSSHTTLEIRKRERKMLDRFCRGSILDVGCGTGYHLSRYENITGIDNSREMLDIAAGKGKVVLADAASLPFPDGSFDTVMSMFNTMDREKLGSASWEMARVLKPGGHLLLSVGSVWEKGPGFLDKLRGRGMRTEKRFRVSRIELRIDLYTRQELVDIFSPLEPAYFDSMFILQKPKWGNLMPFTLGDRIRLKLERLLPSEYGCIYFLAFRK